MSSKRALVVDDSKSARAFLARILERHEIAVDAAESAEAAIEYLTRNKPDVIFMEAADTSKPLPEMTLEVRGAVDATLQKEIAALRGFMATPLEAHAERVHGDLSAVLAPPSPAPLIDPPTFMPERRPWSAIF